MPSPLIALSRVASVRLKRVSQNPHRTNSSGCAIVRATAFHFLLPFEQLLECILVTILELFRVKVPRLCIHDCVTRARAYPWASSRRGCRRSNPLPSAPHKDIGELTVRVKAGRTAEELRRSGHHHSKWHTIAHGRPGRLQDGRAEAPQPIPPSDRLEKLHPAAITS